MKRLSLLILLLILFQALALAQKFPLNLNVDKGTNQVADTDGSSITQMGFRDGQPVSIISLSPSEDVVEEYKYGNMDIYTKRQVDANKDGFVELFVYSITSFEPATGKLLQEIDWYTTNRTDTAFSDQISNREKTQITEGEDFLEISYEQEIVKQAVTIQFLNFLSVKTYEYWNGGCYIRVLASAGTDSTSYESSFDEMHFDFYGRSTWERIFTDKNDDTYFEDKTSHFFLTDSASVLKLDKSLIAKKYDKKSSMEVRHTTKTDSAIKRVYGHDMYSYIKNIHNKSREKIKWMIKKYF